MDVTDFLALLKGFGPLTSLVFSVGALFFSIRADGRAVKGVRPYVATGVHALPNDMRVTLANYGVGLAIITEVSIGRGEMKERISLADLLPSSANFKIDQAISFVQNEYYLRPGDELPLVIVTPKRKENIADALQDWIEALPGVIVEVKYRDILGKECTPYTRDLGKGLA